MLELYATTVSLIKLIFTLRTIDTVNFKHQHKLVDKTHPEDV